MWTPTQESMLEGEEVMFTGFYKAETSLAPGERVFLDYSFMTGGCSGPSPRTFKNMARQEQAKAVRILDARQKEVEEGLSKREFFEKYGFVLLKHETKMSADDWLMNSTRPVPAGEGSEALAADATPRPSPVKEIYAKEVDLLVRDLIPGVTEVQYPSFALRRGPGGPNNFYGSAVHQDYGVYPEDMESIFGDPANPESRSYEEWRAKLRDGSCKGFSIINFWRPVLPMEGPVQSTPLAVCDPNTVELSDVVPQDIFGFVPGGQHSSGLKFNERQQWYYYPDMRKDEVLVFRQFHYDRAVEAPYDRMTTVFHTAFNHPAAPKDAEQRCSSEYRINVYWK